MGGRRGDGVESARVLAPAALMMELESGGERRGERRIWGWFGLVKGVGGRVLRQQMWHAGRVPLMSDS